MESSMHRFLVLFLIVPLLSFCLQSCQQRKIDQHALQSNDPQLNKELGDLYLAKNKLKPNIVTTYSGLQYFVIRKGIGPTPGPEDIVTVYYKGQFINGKAFDEQHFQQNPVSVRIPSLIPGWQQAIQHMQVGSIWIIYVPSELAFGQKGLPGQIPANQALVYTINLVNFRAPN